MEIGKGCFRSGVIIGEGVRIGAGSVISAGQIVMHDVPPSTTLEIKKINKNFNKVQIKFMLKVVKFKKG